MTPPPPTPPPNAPQRGRARSRIRRGRERKEEEKAEAIKGCEREALTARSAFVHAAVHVHVHAHEAADSIMAPPGWRQGSGGSHKDASVGTGELSAVGGVHHRRGDASDPFICSSKPNRKRFSGFFFLFLAFWAPAPPPLGSAPWWDRGGKWDQPFLRLPLLTPVTIYPSIHPASSTPLVPSPPSPCTRPQSSFIPLRPARLSIFPCLFSLLSSSSWLIIPPPLYLCLSDPSLGPLELGGGAVRLNFN